jgi:uncharacterized membrane protein YphA (DoxX/SURF4 family)
MNPAEFALYSVALFTLGGSIGFLCGLFFMRWADRGLDDDS